MLATGFYTLWFLLSLTAVIHLLIFKREPSSTLSWLGFVIAVPVLGALLFLVFGPQRLERKAFKRKREIEKIVSSAHLALAGSVAKDSVHVHPVPTESRPILHLARKISEYGVTHGNRVEMLCDPDQALRSMRQAVEKAKSFIHLEYYIISSDEVTKQLFESLLVAARRGVEVRILYDALGSLFLKRRYFKKLLEHGAKITGFMPPTLVPQRMNVNFRNHRKILVVDGHTAFTGGTNIGREYLGRRNKHQWHDYSVRVEGPVCRQLQDVFAKDWHFTTQEDLFQAKYYPPHESSPGDSLIQVLESGPDTSFQIFHQALFMLITTAREEILLTTPYFIPDPAITTALTTAALRGVKVQLLMPLKSDAPLVRYASRSFYDDLLQAGVQIFEYRPRILHAKLLVIDRQWTMVGSANMDIRSFRLNFELNLLVYGSALANQAGTELFQKDLDSSTQITYEDHLRRGIGEQMLENACRLLSPIL